MNVWQNENLIAIAVSYTTSLKKVSTILLKYKQISSIPQKHEHSSLIAQNQSKQNVSRLLYEQS